ncbi:SMI1 / KNR4 family [[Clostridium] sordellii]|uniref:SMI1/KNR4 family protein n=1 Tax=Paraclostridium sordellii TaxID=1505 RepID=UPI00054439AF|nr:SMI1/KNR4 family protein [Paeniclostridium sordellii]CEK36546.1 SMI1 / KNR4 family [[Clostridium] sordellii] [Paeniclostridium sordellii]
MNKKYEKFIKWAKNNNWNIVESKQKDLNLNESILSRYKNIPNDYLEFLKEIKQVISPNEKTWFICEDEYNNNSDIAFKYNEFEILSLEVAEDDEEWKEEISTWWNKYLPIVMSVDGIYSFYAIDLINNHGCIVKGYEPEFEAIEKVADNIKDFLNLIMSNKIKIS